MKEIQFRPAIANHDLDVKVRKIKQLLTKSQQVRVVIISRGREQLHPEIANALMIIITDSLTESGQPAGVPKLMGNRLGVTFNPLKQL